jgi:ribosomal-protein-alanine N-acetyltransferase
MNTVIQTTVLTLRQFNTNDAGFILELLNTPAWKQFIGDKNVNTHQDAVNYLINGPQATYVKYEYGPWLVSLKESGQPIGMCGLFKRDYLDRPDLGFAFLPGFEGRGLAFEACLATIQYVKDLYHIDKLFAITTNVNLRSRRLLEKCGFLQTGEVKPTDKTLLLYTLALQ